ncbi:sensor histidine kinase [Niastella caeni]|uniref:Oxygen sensor histidine kinase NreB n=1 Tax=Niastella caeni TaxID=2569763 RepID=A0A4S8HZA9_9BACT|nr:sensor histidine kinase [Niastella caeni]THU39514.1 sensor histidine kinase [Niastella caeni]
MKKALNTILFFFIVSLCSAQLVYSLDDDAAYIARMEKEVAAAVTDSAKAYGYLKLSAMCRLIGDTVKIKDYLNRGIALSKPHSFTEAASWFYKAQTLYAGRNIPAIEACLLKGDSLLRSFAHKEAYRVRGYILHAYGTWQQIKGSEKDAMDVFVNRALPVAKQSGDAFLIGNMEKAIATVFMNADRRADAAAYLLRAINNIEQSTVDNPVRIETLVEVYVYAAENYVYMHKQDSAKPNLDKASRILSSKANSNLNLAYYCAEGIWFHKNKQYSEAVASFDKGIALGKAEPRAQYSVNRLKGVKYKSLFSKKDYTAALAVIHDLLKSPLVFTQDKKMYYKDLAETYAAAGNKAEAYKWADKYIVISDSLYQAKFQNDIIEFEKKYNNAENQKKISLLQAANEKAALVARNHKLLAWLLGGFSIFLLALAILGWLYYRNSRKLSEQQELSYQQQLKDISQQQQLKLAAALLQGEERERKRLAGDLHDGLGGMLAGVKINLSRLSPVAKEEAFTKELPVIINQLDRSVNELRRIARNMMPESLLNSGLEIALKEICESFTTDALKVDFQAYNIEKDIAQEMQVTIYRIVQELLANAVRHAAATAVLVQCSQNENTFYITVEDNGRGFSAEQINGGKGIGLTNVKNRVDYLKGTLEIESAPGAGTTINIEFHVS